MRRLNARKPKMDPIKLQTRSNNLFSRNPNPRQPKVNLCILSSILIALIILFSYLFFFPTKPVPNSTTLKHAIVIDGGSTGTRIHVFSYTVDGGKNLDFDFGEKGLASMRVNPGLSAFSEDPDGAGRSLGELLEFARNRVPRDEWEVTEIRLMATAGMRLLDVKLQDRILDSCRRVLRKSGFKFMDEWATVITGSDEGVYAWVVANYALGTLGGDPLRTTGIIELGGASAQVTFFSSEPLPPEFSRIVKIDNTAYNLYSHSFLHFGQNVAFESLKELLVSADYDRASAFPQKTMLTDPCIPKGYPHTGKSKLSPGSVDDKHIYTSPLQSSGNFSECRSATSKLLQKGKDKCTSWNCYIGSTFTPKIQGKFLATENFFHTTKFFGLAEKGVLSDLVVAGQRFCEEDWSVLKKRYSSLHDEDLLRYCFSSAYIVALLHDSLGIALDDKRIGFTNQVGSTPLDWALGAFILQSTSGLDAEYPDWISAIISEESPKRVSLIAVFIIFMLMAWTVLKWRKPQLKTIYDLEKGRYIITRVNRY